MQTVLILDDLSESRALLIEMVRGAFETPAIHTADSLRTARELTRKEAFDLALVDLDLPDGSGISFIRHLQTHSPQTISVVVTIFEDGDHLFPAIRAGAQGYLLKDQPAEVLAERLKGLANGEPPLSPSMARKMLEYFANGNGEESVNVHLSPREEDVLVLVSRGLSRAEIANVLKISHHTVSRYIKDLYKKIGVNSRAEAAVIACQMGLIKMK